MKQPTDAGTLWNENALAACAGMSSPLEDVSRLKMLLLDVLKLSEANDSVRFNAYSEATRQEARELLTALSFNYRISFNGVVTDHTFVSDQAAHRYCEGMSDTAAMPLLEKEIDGSWLVWDINTESFVMRAALATL